MTISSRSIEVGGIWIRTLRRREKLRVMMASLLLVSFVASGCMTIGLDPIDPALPIDLDEGEGLLVIQLDSDLPIKKMYMDMAVMIRPLAKGKHIWITKIPQGWYSWRSVEIDGKGGPAGRYELKRSSYSRPDELDFLVKAGAINFAGELIIRSAGRQGRRYWLSFRNRNHGAMALRELLRTHAEVLDVYPLRTAGTGDDSFIEFYVRERDAIRREKNSISQEVNP